MTTLVVLFNLKSDADRATYEAWAQSTDLPIVRDLTSVDAFDVYRTSGRLGTDDPAPYEYVEIIQVNDMETFGGEVKSETMQKVAAEFREFADAPCFMLSEALGS
ncbi:MAG: REDY-like protein HapK [Pseudomonadota bacterium]